VRGGKMFLLTDEEIQKIDDETINRIENLEDDIPYPNYEAVSKAQLKKDKETLEIYEIEDDDEHIIFAIPLEIWQQLKQEAE